MEGWVKDGVWGGLVVEMNGWVCEGVVGVRWFLWVGGRVKRCVWLYKVGEVWWVKKGEGLLGERWVCVGKGEIPAPAPAPAPAPVSSWLTWSGDGSVKAYL
jgi:hypothetical protein